MIRFSLIRLSAHFYLAEEHIKLYARFKGIPSDMLEEYISEKLDLVALTNHSYKSSAALSGGMRRRLSIVLASVGSPNLLILDEPTTG